MSFPRLASGLRALEFGFRVLGLKIRVQRFRVECVWFQGFRVPDFEGLEFDGVPGPTALGLYGFRV